MRAALVFVALCITQLIGVASASVGRLDPCTTPGKITKGRGFFIGLAFWPGGAIEDWGPVLNETTGELGLQPCLANTTYMGSDTGATHQEHLISKGVVFAAYEVRVDRMTVLRGNATEQSQLLDGVANATGVVSIVAFRGGYRSPARYFASANATETVATGTVRELAAIARVDTGQLTDLQWSDVTCGACGGRGSSRCIRAVSSDATQYSCTVTTANCTGSLTDPCLPSVYLGFSGTDKNHRTFQSGYQITKINQFSLVAFYQRASDVLSGILDTISTGGLGDSGVNNGGVGQDGGDGGDNGPAA